MNDLLLQIFRFFLVAVFVAMMAICAWANSRMIKRGRESGHRYWMINPLATLAASRGPEPLIFLTCLLVNLVVFSLLLVLNG